MNIDSHYKTRKKRLSMIVFSFAMTNFFLLYRIERSNTWLPDVPLVIGVWEPIDSPIAQDFLSWLGGATVRGVEWENPLSERISSQFIAVRSYQSFRKPEVFFTLNVTAQRQLPLFGPNRSIDAWILKAPQNQGRMLVYSWLQTPSGQTYSLNDTVLSESFLQRIQMGWLLITTSEPLCLVRMSCPIPSFDKNGLQTRRDMNLIAKTIYEFNKGKQK